ncbi:Succinyl-CoA:(R)-benzylsuccinate CoA-transferase subunit BbsE [bacterium HR10]|nr:Succinyl-CoA:(R)-benzylsuccinate CoA-transferase subunit BbsE [bacterium HR10]
MLLGAYRVIEIADEKGALAGKIFADLGADVIKVEPPRGDPARRRPPLTAARDGTPISLFWLALNVNKRGITLAWETPTGRELLLRLIERVDFVIESLPPGTLQRSGLGWETLHRVNPRLILISITPFGQEGPYRDFLGSDLEVMALSGTLSLAGEEDGEPMRVSVPQAFFWAGVEAVMGGLTALAFRAVSGRGQHVDVSAQVAAMAPLAMAPAHWDLNRVNPLRAGIFVTGRSVTGAKMRALWRCRDGWINFIIYGGAAGRHTNQQLVAWMRERGMAPSWLTEIDWSRFEVTQLTQEEVDRLEAPIAEFFLTITKQEFLQEAIRRQMLGYPVSTVADIASDPQLEARGFWQEVRDPTTGRSLRYPGGFAVINGERLPLRRPAPRCGEHNAEVFAEIGVSEADLQYLAALGIV